MLETPVYIHSDGHVADMRHIAYGRAHGSRLLNLAGSGVSMHPCIIQWYFMPRTGYMADGSIGLAEMDTPRSVPEPFQTLSN